MKKAIPTYVHKLAFPEAISKTFADLTERLLGDSFVCDYVSIHFNGCKYALGERPTGDCRAGEVREKITIVVTRSRPAEKKISISTAKNDGLSCEEGREYYSDDFELNVTILTSIRADAEKNDAQAAALYVKGQFNVAFKKAFQSEGIIAIFE